MSIQWRRHTDGNKIHIFNKTKVRGSTQFSRLHQCLQIVVHDIADVIMSGIDELDLFVLYVKSRRLKSRTSLLHSQRQTDIA